MALTPYSADPNVITSLPTYPSAENITAAQLKAYFDQDNVAFKAYFNDVHLGEVTADIISATIVKVDTSSIVNDLVTGGIAVPLSAEMGVTLGENVDTLSANLDALVIGKFGAGFVTDTMLSATGVKAQVAEIPQQTYITEKEKTVDANAKLALKLDKTGTITVSQLDKNKGLIDETYLTDTLKAQIAGTTAIGSTPPDNSITPVKTTFFGVGKNLFDKSLATLEKYVRDTDGTLYPDAAYFASDYIAVEPNTTYTRTHEFTLAFYDSSKVFLLGITPAQNLFTFTTPATCYYLRVSTNTTNIDAFQLEKGGEGTAYEPFGLVIPTEKIGVLDGKQIQDKTIPAAKVDFIIIGKNKFDKTTVTTGFFVNHTNGTLASNGDYSASDYIEVEPNTNYIDNANKYLAFYDADKKYISGLSQDHALPYTTPSTSKYMRVSVKTTVISLDAFQIEKGNAITAYEPFGYVLNKGLYLASSEKSLINFTVEAHIAPKIPALVGKEVNIYFENILNDRAINYQVDVACGIGKHQNDRWTCVPLTAGTFPMTISIYKNYTLVTSVTTSVVVKNVAVGTGVTKKALIIGDSTTANGIAVTELSNLFSADAMNIDLLGTRGIAPSNHEGISGWTVDFFKNLAQDAVTPDVNEFYNPTTTVFDFSYYMTQQGYSGVDYVVINLGINDVFSFTTDVLLNAKITAMLSDYQFLVDSIKTYSTAIKIGIAVTIPPNYSQDAFGYDYSNGQTQWRYKRNNFLWVKAMLNYFTGQEAQGIYLVPINVNLDTVNNMGLLQEAANSRNAAVVTRAFSGVHPVPSGYCQIADVLWYWLKSFEV